MKTSILLFCFIILFACAPEKTMNRKISGTWSLVSINGIHTDSSSFDKVTFKPEGRNGTISYHVNRNEIDIDSIGSYAIMKYEYLTSSFKDTSKLGYDETIFKFTKCTENELILTQQNQNFSVYTFKKEN
jgi:hypothetical protein